MLMVANTDTIPMNTSPPTFIPSFNMNSSQNLFQPIDLWTKDDVQKWIEFCIDEYALGDINLNDFKMNGKALLLLNEDGFKQRSLRSGDILYKALQQRHAVIKSMNCQTFPYHFGLLPPSFMRHFNIPLPPPPTMNYLHPAFNRPEIKYQTDFTSPHSSIRTRQISDSSSSSVNKSDIPLPVPLIKQECINHIDQNETVPTPFIPTQIHSKLTKQQSNNNKQIRYYQDRVDFHGEILMKPQAAKTCRILWEFLYILLEDPLYESIIHWENREKMIFRIIQADKLAALWGLQKNRLSMTYEKLSRGMRYYYSSNIIAKEQSKRLLYRFMRSPDEIRRSMKRQGNTANIIYSTINKKSSFTTFHNQNSSNQYLQFFSNLNSTNNLLFPISKSDRASSSSPDSLDSSHDSEKQYCTKRKQAIPISLTTRLSHDYSFDQPMNLAVPKQEETVKL